MIGLPLRVAMGATSLTLIVAAARVSQPAAHRTEIPGRPEGRTTLQLKKAGALVTAVQGDKSLDEGARLFVAYNCADCHGAGGSGAMGPSLQDNRWRFGGSATEVYRSIAEGRPEGMPAWGPLIPSDHITKLAAYVRSLGAGKDVTTENFTGSTIERSGH